MENEICSVCKAPVEEDAPILAMGGFGQPRYLCPTCSKDLDIVTEGTKPALIRLAMSNLSDRISRAECEDGLTIGTLDAILEHGAARAEAIENGEDPDGVDEDYEEEEEFSEIPEDLAETAEDRALDEKEAAAAKKFDKVLNILWIVLGVAAVAFIIWRIFFK